jgi:pimeloyl-ACP methyl ester carboxylesterase
MTVILMRRGYGTSGGKFAEAIGECSRPDYFHSSLEADRDIRAAIMYLSKLREVDSARILLVGVSSGGFATVALTADPPPGIVAAINFAGGNGSRAEDEVCRPENLVDAFGTYGKTSRIPMLWVYSENDHYFSSALANRFYEAFTKTGGHAELRRAPSFQDDGHLLFSFEGIPIWTRYVDEFLKNQKLMPRSDLLPPPPLPNVPPPVELGPAWRGAFSYYLAAPTVKAFAVSSDGFFGYRFGELTGEEAKRDAIHNCDQRTAKHDCRVVFFNDRPVK